MKKIVIAALLAGLSSLSFAANEGYVTDTNGNIIKNNFGQCWRTGSWTAKNATLECDSELLPKEIKVQEKEAIVVPKLKPTLGEKPISIENTTVLFDFGSATLTKEAKATLKSYVEKYKNILFKVESLTIVGRADKIGTEQYNYRLSKKRANVVAEYLNELLEHTEFARKPNLKIEGIGESEPLTNCPSKINSKTIKCLAPDRRVDISASEERVYK